jgi:hypothetical protein
LTDLAALHVGATLWMCAIIWYVQCVHYPSFHFVASDQFQRFHADHSRATTFLVLPPMLTELSLSAWGVWQTPVPRSLVILALTLGTWLLTFLVAVLLHHRLSAGYDAEVVRRLVRRNVWRTALWTGKLGFLLFF